MGIKTAFTAAIAAGALTYGAQETQKQVFYDCTGEFGRAELINPNRYSLPGLTDIHIVMTTPDGQTQRYDYIKGWRSAGEQVLTEEAAQLCRTGQPSAKLRLGN